MWVFEYAPAHLWLLVLRAYSLCVFVTFFSGSTVRTKDVSLLDQCTWTELSHLLVKLCFYFSTFTVKGETK